MIGWDKMGTRLCRIDDKLIDLMSRKYPNAKNPERSRRLAEKVEQLDQGIGFIEKRILGAFAVDKKNKKK